MKLFVCKNHDLDGDVHFALFKTEHHAREFCLSIDAFSPDGAPLYWEVELTDDVDAEFIKYQERG